MFRIRFHGRGGQGMKTASRILGRAFFLEGYEVQDAPRYGAERRGAPIFAYVRADRQPIHERGIIIQPDLVLVADESLLGIPAAGVLQGVTERTCLVIHGREQSEVWQHRLSLSGPVLVLPTTDSAQQRFSGTICAAAAASLSSNISWRYLEQAIHLELANLDPELINRNVAIAQDAFDAMIPHQNLLTQQMSAPLLESRPAWIDLQFEPSPLSTPAIHTACSSEEVKTGLWRTLRPEIDRDLCHKCWWVCSTFCPDGAIQVDSKNHPHIDYDHCKGCMVCLAQCPHHAIRAVVEQTQPGKEVKP